MTRTTRRSVIGSAVLGQDGGATVFGAPWSAAICAPTPITAATVPVAHARPASPAAGRAPRGERAPALSASRPPS
jgi:hypothetical protein